MDEKEMLHRHRRVRRENLLGKLDGLSEYNVRRQFTDNLNLTQRSPEEWAAHRATIEDAARAAVDAAPQTSRPG